MKDTEKIVTALHLAPQLNIDKMTNEIFVIRQHNDEPTHLVSPIEHSAF